MVNVEQHILNNKNNALVLDDILKEHLAIKTKYDWQLDQFMGTYVDTNEGMDRLNDGNANDPVYRYYNYKAEKYSTNERIIRTAQSFRNLLG